MRSPVLRILIVAAMLLLASHVRGHADPPGGTAYPATATLTRGAFFDGKSVEQFAIHEVEVDLTDLGVAEDGEVTTLYLRGAEYRSGRFEWVPNLVWVVDRHGSLRPD